MLQKLQSTPVLPVILKQEGVKDQQDSPGICYDIRSENASLQQKSSAIDGQRAQPHHTIQPKKCALQISAPNDNQTSATDGCWHR
jgi:hypothetical protein